MERILVGVDGSEAAQDALAWAADLAARAELELIVARVFAPTQVELPPDTDRTLHAEQLAELDAWCGALPVALGRRRAVLLDGDPPGALLAAAVDEQVDLLVVGSRGTGGFAHLHLGSVAHHLSHHTTLPSAIVPRTGSAPTEHVVVGVDGSDGSLAAVALCADLAAGLGVGVTAVYAFEPMAEWVPESDPHSWRRQAEAEARSWAAPIVSAGVTLEVDVDRDTHPVAAINRVLASRSGSIAVVGTRGRGGFPGLRLGRIPLQLVHHTSAAVILVPERVERGTVRPA